MNKTFRRAVVSAVLFASASVASAAELLSNVQLAGTSNQVKSGAVLTVVGGGKISIASGGTLEILSGATVTFATGIVPWVAVSKSGSTLADLATRSASDLSSGTLPDARFPATLPAISGANLTALNASNLASGTIPDARFPATLPALSGANLTALNASNLASGTIPDARFPATLPAASGANLTALNASNLASGTTAIVRGGTGADTAAGALDALITAESSVASAGTTDLGAVTSRNISITGTTTITSFGTSAAGVMRFGRFAAALTLTHNGTSLILPTGANITTAANDRFVAVSLGSGNWFVYFYQRADGTPLAGGGGGGGSGTVTHTSGALTSNAVILGNGTDDVKAVAGITSDGTSKIVLGVAGTSVGGVDFKNATSGTITLAPVTGALGTVTLSLPAATDTLVGRATTDTLTNKTLTSPRVGTGILDTNGNELVLFTATSSAVNEITVANAATGNNPTITTTGGDSTIGLTITPKAASSATATLRLLAPTSAHSQFVIDRTTDATFASYVDFKTAGTTKAAIGIDNGSGGLVTGASANDLVVRANNQAFAVSTNSGSAVSWKVAYTASAVNGLQLTPGATGAHTTLTTIGSDSKVDIILTPKAGSGDTSTAKLLAPTGTHSQLIIDTTTSSEKIAYVQFSLGGSAKGYIGATNLTGGTGYITGSNLGDIGIRTQGSEFLVSTDSGSTIAARVSSSGQLIAEKTTNSTTTTSGALVSKGGLGVASDVVTGGSIKTGTPSGGTAAAWKFGTVATVSPTSPNRTIELDVGGTRYFLAAKTTND